MKKVEITFLSSLFVVLMLSAYAFCANSASIEVKPEEIQLGEITERKSIKSLFIIKNIGLKLLQIKKIRSSCDCMTVSAFFPKIQAGGEESVEVILEPKALRGKFTKYLYIQSNDPKRPVMRVKVKGILKNDSSNGRDVRKNISEPKASEAGKIEAVLFYNHGCRECRQIKNVFLHKLEDRYHIAVKFYDIALMDNYLKLVNFEKRYNVRENDPMIIFVGNRYFSGEKVILKELEPYIKQLLLKEIAGKKEIAEKVDDKELLFARFKSFTPLVIVSAGLIDGINPCVFTTIVFLVSFLYFAKKRRREIFFVGLVFSFAVFLAYLLIGLGLREILYKLDSFKAISGRVYSLAVCALFILACYSLYDAFVYLRYGAGKNMKLRLPVMVTRKIHNIIRNSLGMKGLMFSVFFVGFFVSMLEGICTGQVYLPVIMFMVKEPSVRDTGFYYLILYNLAFIFPLIIVMALVSLGISSGRFISFSKKNTFVAKLLLAGIFFTLGALLILAR